MAQSFALQARELRIVWSENPQYWTWKQDPTLGYEVAELRNVWWLEITNRFDSAQLSKSTNYDFFLVYKMLSNARGLDRARGYARLSKEMPDGTSDEGFTVFLNPKPDGSDQKGLFPTQREDGWLEIKLGDYFNESGSDGEIFMRLFHNDSNAKRGLVVRTIEIRPVSS